LESYLKLAPAPKELDSIKCDGTKRRLAAKSKCKKEAATCQAVKMVGYIETALPAFVIPAPQTAISFSTLIVNALLLASVALLEHVANVKMYADKNDYSVSLSMDLVAVGLSNVFGAIFGSFISAGGFSRSALNAQAKSQFSGLMSVFISFFIVLAAAPLLSLLPHSALNVILFMAVIHLVDTKIVVELFKLGRRGLQDLISLLIAFVATCFLGVVQGMMIAIGFSLVVFIFNSSYPEIVEIKRISGSMNYEVQRAEEEVSKCGFKVPSKAVSRPAAIKTLRFEGAMWFANVSHLNDVVLTELKSERLHSLILDMSAVPRIDTTAGAAMKKMLVRAKESGVVIAFAACHNECKTMLQMSCSVPENAFFEQVFEAEIELEERRTMALEEGNLSVSGSEPDQNSTPETLNKNPTSLAADLDTAVVAPVVEEAPNDPCQDSHI